MLLTLRAFLPKRASGCAALLSFIGAVCAFNAPARAEYRLSTGDVLELSVAGVPDLRVRATVDLDGTINLPILGNLPAKGLSLDVLRTGLQSELAKRQIPIRDPNGRATLTSIAPEDISIRIAEYRPVYLNGDVSRPGEIAYRPGLSVRQAIAIAGGYDVMRTRISNPYADVVEYQAQGAMLARELAVEEERIKQLQSQLGSTATNSAGSGEGKRATGSPEAEVAVIKDRINLQQQDYEKQLRYILSAEAFASSRATMLNDQKSKEEEGSKADIEDYERSKALFEKGTVSTQRVSDARRAMLLSSTRALQTAVEATRAQREYEQIARDSQQLQDQNRIRLLTDLQDALSRRARTAAQLVAAQQKLAITGTLKPSWSDGQKPAAITLYRIDEKGVENKTTVSEATTLMPGDVVEISVKLPAF